MPIPEYLERVAAGDFQGAIDIIRSTSLIPSICSRVCPHERQCESSCTLGKLLKDPKKGVHLGNMERFCADYEREHLGGKKAASRRRKHRKENRDHRLGAPQASALQSIYALSVIKLKFLKNTINSAAFSATAFPNSVCRRKFWITKLQR